MEVLPTPESPEIYQNYVYVSTLNILKLCVRPRLKYIKIMCMSAPEIY